MSLIYMLNHGGPKGGLNLHEHALLSEDEVRKVCKRKHGTLLDADFHALQREYEQLTKEGWSEAKIRERWMKYATE